MVEIRNTYKDGLVDGVLASLAGKAEDSAHTRFIGALRELKRECGLKGDV